MTNITCIPKIVNKVRIFYYLYKQKILLEKIVGEIKGE